MYKNKFTNSNKNQESYTRGPSRRTNAYSYYGKYRWYDARRYGRPMRNNQNSAGLPIEGSEVFTANKIRTTGAHNVRRYSKQKSINQTRSCSPVEGSEEFMARKIKTTSALIMRQLLSPNEPAEPLPKTPVEDSNVVTVQYASKGTKKKKEKINEQSTVTSSDYDVKAIQEKIMGYITNLNTGRKQNFINADVTGLDDAIQHIQKQKRLELSQVLRYMCSKPDNAVESEVLLNSIIPDIGINLQELPLNVIQELEATLKFDFDEEIPELGLNPNETAPLTEPYVDSQPHSECEKIEIKVEDLREYPYELNHTLDEIKEESPNEPQNENLNFNSCCNLDSSTSFSAETEFLYGSNFNCLNKEGSCNIAGPVINIPVITTHYSNAQSQTEVTTKYSDSQCQTDHCLINGLFDTTESELESYLTLFLRNYTEGARNGEDIRHKAKFIHQCVKRLNESLESLLDFDTNSSNKTVDSSEIEHANSEDKRIVKKRKLDSNVDDDIITIKSEPDIQIVNNNLQFPKLTEKVSVIQKIKNQLIIATEKGKVITISQETGEFIHILEITSVALTSLLFMEGMNGSMYMYVGSHDITLKIYDFNKKQLIKGLIINEMIYCMDSMWDYVFLGCQSGTLIRYSILKRKIEMREKGLGSSVMVIKALCEGPRKVLLMGYKKAPIYLRCATTGLVLRNFSHLAVSPTVYALLLQNNFIYCGTSEYGVRVFSFHDGTEINVLQGNSYIGITCLKIFKDYLFAGCCTGSVAVYNLKTQKQETVLEGPGGGIICMEVLNNQIIVGTLSNKFASIPIPFELVS